MQPLDGKKPLIEYPCSWTYQVIGLDEQALRQAAAEVLGDVQHTLRSGNTSKGGKYLSLGLVVQVRDEGQRLRIFELLSAHSAVRFVL
jgi:putative lipoic acid-binding regulatory protein